MPHTLNLAELDVVTVSGTTFSGEDSARLAVLVYKRFGNMADAHQAWCRLLENHCSERWFAALVSSGLRLEEGSDAR